jgi:pyruvate dehydrogenase E1 component
MKKLTLADLKEFRDRLHLPITDEQLEENPTCRRTTTRARSPTRSSTCKERRAALGGYLPRAASVRPKPLKLPGEASYARPEEGLGQAADRHHDGVRPAAQGPDEGQGDRRAVRADHPGRGAHLRHGLALPDGEDLLPHGQTYEAVDRELLLSYKESKQGQILHEGINEAGATASLIAAGTSYATHGEPMIPIYIFYSMFGFQRTGDQFWQLADQMAAASCSAPPPAAPR